MSHIIDWQNAADPRDVVGQAVQSLREGKLIAFPTETVYGLAAIGTFPGAVDRLCQSKGRPQEKPLTIAIRRPEDLLAWVPEASALAKRLARRCWPGPLTLVLPVDPQRGLIVTLPEAVRKRVAPAGSIGLRVPAHDAILETLDLLGAPLILTSANRSGEPAASTGQGVLQALGDDVDLVIDAGATHFGQASTVVRVDGDHWRILREGVLSAELLRRQAARMIVFVCTGNTCRSPMAEALCKKMMADRLGCKIGELPERGYLVLSMGVAAEPGCEAAPEALEAVAQFGADLSEHQSRPASWLVIEQADHILTMTHHHLHALHHLEADLHGRIGMLSPAGQDIPDPLGQDSEVYRQCAAQIREALGHRLSEWIP